MLSLLVSRSGPGEDYLPRKLKVYEMDWSEVNCFQTKSGDWWCLSTAWELCNFGGRNDDWRGLVEMNFMKLDNLSRKKCFKCWLKKRDKFRVNGSISHNVLVERKVNPFRSIEETFSKLFVIYKRRFSDSTTWEMWKSFHEDSIYLLRVLRRQRVKVKVFQRI